MNCFFVSYPQSNPASKPPLPISNQMTTGSRGRNADTSWNIFGVPQTRSLSQTPNQSRRQDLGFRIW